MNKETAIDKVLESAVQQLCTALIELGECSGEGEVTFWEVEKRFGEALMSFACQSLAVVLSMYDMDAKYVRFGGEVWRRGTKRRTKSYHSIWGKLRVACWTLYRAARVGSQALDIVFGVDVNHADSRS